MKRSELVVGQRYAFSEYGEWDVERATVGTLKGFGRPRVHDRDHFDISGHQARVDFAQFEAVRAWDGQLREMFVPLAKVVMTEADYIKARDQKAQAKLAEKRREDQLNADLARFNSKNGTKAYVSYSIIGGRSIRNGVCMPVSDFLRLMLILDDLRNRR